MKKILSLLTLAIMLIGSASCQKMQTELSGEELSTKVPVTGFVRYIWTDSLGKPSQPTIVNPGTEVNIYYGIKDGKGNIEYALKTVKTDSEGRFQIDLGCIPGKTLTVKAQSSILSETYARVLSGTSYIWVPTQAYFYGEKEEDTVCGKAICLTVDMTATAKIGQPDMK